MGKRQGLLPMYSAYLNISQSNAKVLIMGLEDFTEFDHNVTFDPKGLAYLFSGLTISVGLIIAIYFLAKSVSN